MPLVYRRGTERFLRKLPDNADKDDCDWELLEKAAENYYYEFDGVESNWPIHFTVIDSDTEEIICEGEVQMEYEPTFRA